jgi:D-alanyl-D-alanine carboxypeptidase
MIQARPRPAFQIWVSAVTLVYAAAVGLLTAVLAGCGTAGSSDQKLATDLRQDLDNYLTARASSEHISTLSMTVSFRGGASDINISTGTTQYGGGTAVTPSNVFQTGSNTKAFTAVAILQLEAAGLLSINDTLGKWLPQYPQYANVTIKQILNMTSGIPGYDGTTALETDMGNNPMKVYTPEDLIAYVYPTIKTPGAAWEYSNTGYILAQMIVDKMSASGSYEAALDGIISSNNLPDTFYQPDFYPQSITQRLVSGYFVNTDDANTGVSKLLGQDTSGFSLGWAQGAGGMVSTPEALTRWVRALFEGNVLPPKQLQELESLVSMETAKPISSTSPSDPKGFGLGVAQVTDPKLGLFWAYQGSTIGYRATYEYFPDSGLIICIFTNSQTSSAQNQVTAQLFPKVFATLKAAGRI